MLSAVMRNLIFVALLILVGSCKDDVQDEKYPPYDQISCLLNGKRFVPKGGHLGCTNTIISWIDSTNTKKARFIFSFEDCDSVKAVIASIFPYYGESILFPMSDTMGTFTFHYGIDSARAELNRYYPVDGFFNTREFEEPKVEGSNVTNGYIKATFEMTFVDTLNYDTLHVTNGSVFASVHYR